ncbi:hypothetical protein BDQ12DRAFT_727356 [Crucibulum laeve]|uniref:Nephrocystin 3-like N-terminal domain-containing protein n=1 Tax=Crucibulum laeve TaxID=68775 RepID=A0A5C3LM52_9AGAR|nr:hypothetical protein BDQ12DRAFT_727356 [Crucibulum laeve]
MISKYVEPVLRVLKTLDGIVSEAAKMHPAAAIIWGSVKIVLDGLDRFSSLFETIKNELQSLTTRIDRINSYNKLYGKDAKMQQFLFKSYINIIRFWHRVDKECSNGVFSSLLLTSPWIRAENGETTVTYSVLKSIASINTQKLATIISDMQKDALDITDHADILFLEEFREGQKESKAALMELQDHNRKMDESQQRDVINKIISWLSTHYANDPNYQRHQKNRAEFLPGTCQWLLGTPDFIAWWRNHLSPPIIWIHGPPGSGKSVLCSRIIELLTSSSTVVAFQFFDFAQRYEPLQTFSMVARQLLSKYLEHFEYIPEEMLRIPYSSPFPLAGVQELITAMVRRLPNVYFFLDGLDEEAPTATSRWRDMLTVLDFFLTLAEKFPKNVRLWCSSQYRDEIGKKLARYPTIDISNNAKEDVVLFLSKSIPDIDLLDLSDQEKFLKKTQERAEWSFLYAQFMVNALKHECNSLGEMEEFIEEGFPDDLVGYYKNIFQRLRSPIKPLASKVFSLITFARRPLRFSELLEAIWCLQSKSEDCLRPADKPFPQRLLEVTRPLISLIKLEGVTGVDEDYICRLTHSTLQDFLISHPDVLCEPNNPSLDLRISVDAAVNACLFYLGQSRYGELLEAKDTQWLDKNGESIDSHHFLIYAAKYWDKHLDDITDDKRQQELVKKLQAFLDSPNFLTCVQVQSLWVEAQFQVFHHSGDRRVRFLRRVFPLWLSRETEVGKEKWFQYRQFLHEWKYLLSCGSCGNGNTKCRILPHMGQLRRIWFGALCHRNFLRRFKSQFNSFNFQSEGSRTFGDGHFYDAIGQSGRNAVILRTPTLNEKILHFTCETWSLSSPDAPVLQKSLQIEIDSELCSWSLYTNRSTPKSMLAGRAAPVGFGPDLQTLRIGSQIFSMDKLGVFTSVLKASDHAQLYVEDFARRENITVVVSRTKVSSIDAVTRLFSKESEKAERQRKGEANSDIEESSSDDESWYGSESESGCSSEGYESWSEASTIGSEECLFDDDMISPWGDHVADEDSSSSSSDEGDAELPVVTGIEEDENESADEEELELAALFSYGRRNPDEEYGWDEGRYYSDDEDNYGIFVPSRGDLPHYSTGQAVATITIVDTNSPQPTRLFHLTRPLICKLYGSPPVIHQTKPLVVWPLSAGELLFVDFEMKSYFARKLRPSTSNTRHVFMKCHFSNCGCYLHIVALEGKHKMVPRKGRKRLGEAEPINFAVVVSTYRLSSRKTTRSPPTLIHLAKAEVGIKNNISVSKLPYTVTWAEDKVYVTCNEKILRVYCIPLFPTTKGCSAANDDLVLSPRNLIFLPETAENRTVYYFPPNSGSKDEKSSLGRLIIGGETLVKSITFTETDEPETWDFYVKDLSEQTANLEPGEFCPPVGCYVSEEDLGGWEKSKDRKEIPPQMGIGFLDRRLEKFNPEDDCDLEPYIF